MIRATLSYIFVTAYTLICLPLALVWTHLTRKPHLLYVLGRFCVRIVGWFCRIRIVCHGKEKLLAAQTYVFLSNHQGNLDGPILIHATQRDLRALIKRELMNVPVLSVLLRNLQFIAIDRTDPRDARAGIDDGAELLKQGCSFFAFPEGTRSRDGRLGGFKRGVFVLALKAGVPIVPVSIVGSRDLQPPGSYIIRPGRVDLYFHDPIPTAHMSLEDRHQLLAQTRAAVASVLEQNHARPSGG